MDKGITLTIFCIVTISCLTIIVTVSLVTRVVSRRKAERQEFQKLRRDISQIKSSIDDMKEQLADIIIRLS